MGETEKQGRILMWGARVGSLVVSGFWIVSLVLNAIRESEGEAFRLTLEGSLLFLLVVSSSIAAVYAWIDPLSGGKFTIVSSLFLSILAYFSAAQDRLMAVAISGLPYFLIGLLFIQSQNTEGEAD
jgi:CHASE2 domain-containing sensor protein